MDYFGINSADELPKINEVLADQIVSPTLVQAEHFEVDEDAVLLVTEEGELIDKGIEPDVNPDADNTPGEEPLQP